MFLYDLTSTYFESDPPVKGKRAYGYSRDHRGDCLQVAIALIVTPPQGFPLTYEVMPVAADNTTSRAERGRMRHEPALAMDGAPCCGAVFGTAGSASSSRAKKNGNPQSKEASQAA